MHADPLHVGVGRRRVEAFHPGRRKFPDGLRQHDPVGRPRHRLFLERKNTDADLGDGDVALVVGPDSLPPQLHAEGAALRIPQPLAVVQP